ncbi:DEKNAAC102153 [Brettanomyces naardenensis]|uniref:DEKNAAC102153 n=1 Tax=Brettanomyces naardenensis TaxID=13370 RepID=A0A448YJY5_BRENA|nr:DEKNAAC102153 [Brettanomyces naardenensis]
MSDTVSSTPASTPHSSTHSNSNLLTTSGLSEIKLTPIKNLKDVPSPNRKELTETLRKAEIGQTLLPETLKFPESMFTLQRKMAFPQASSSPKRNSGVSVSFFNSQPGLRISRTRDGTLNPVKGAYNVFDKRMASNTTSPGRKRKRIPTPDNMEIENRTRDQTISVEGEPMEPSEPQERQKEEKPAVHSAFYLFTQKLLTDPQCVTNLTLIIQILLNALVFATFIVVIFLCFLSVKRDVDRKVQTYMNDLVHQINGCRRDYLRNNCAPEMRVPALENSCNEWDNCMSQDPESVITSVAYFEIMAECMNAFFHNLSFRTLFGLAVLLFFSVVLPNLLFNKFRSTNGTTTNNTYYNITHDQSTQQSPVRIIDQSQIVGTPQRLLDNNASNLNNSTIFFTPTQGDEIRSVLTPSPTRKKGSELKTSSVRFNPNVSYSFYDNDDTNYMDASPTIRRRNRY